MLEKIHVQVDPMTCSLNNVESTFVPLPVPLTFWQTKQEHYEK